jgi:hypothetical protein
MHDNELQRTLVEAVYHAPDFISERNQLLFICRVKLLRVNGIYQETGLELCTTEHNATFNQWMTIDNRFCKVWLANNIEMG